MTPEEDEKISRKILILGLLLLGTVLISLVLGLQMSLTEAKTMPEVVVYSGEESILEVEVPSWVWPANGYILPGCPCMSHGGMVHEGTFHFRVSTGAMNIEETTVCQVKFYCVNKASRYEIVDFLCVAKKARECHPGEYKIETYMNGCIYGCNDSGYWELVKGCDKNERLEYDPKFAYDGWDCVKKPSTPGFEVIFVIVGLITACVIYRRRK